MFKDKIYEEMDDISKLIEPYQFSVNEELASFPDSFEVDASQIDSRYVSLRSIITSKARELGLSSIIDCAYDIERNSFFKMKLLDEFNEPTEYINFNFKTGTLYGKIVVYKDKIGFEDEHIHTMCQNNASSYIRHMGWRNADSSRINEVADLLGMTEVLKEKSKRIKMHVMCSEIQDIIKTKKIDIRDANLASRFGKWIMMYIAHGSLPSLANLAKIKIMSHQNRPIYSMQEQEV